MRSSLAEKLLIKVMNWSVQEVAEERPLIQSMANLKYDEYQQFSPGIRFTESLAQWLSQFDVNERISAYEFIKSHLIFVSSEQMTHLVSICFAEKINPWLLGKVAALKKIPRYYIKTLYNSPEYKEIKRRSLFLGISDGAKIDQLRRSCGISNEQVFSSYYVSAEKKDDMLKELKNDGYDGKFQSIYLMDDFTGSGLSYARMENGESTGKLIKFLKLIFNIAGDTCKPSVLSNLIDVDNLDIHILFYIARFQSIEYLKGEIESWETAHNLKFTFSVDAIQVLDENLKREVKANLQIIDLSKKYISEQIIDRHYKKGNYEEYYLGFDECALPLILHHNTPNNSLPILWWYPEDEKFRGLFPRITRHRE